MNLNPEILLAKSIAETIYWAKRCYYDGHPTLHDENYDKLEQELNRICPGHPILDVVGNPGDNDSCLLGFVDLRKLIEAKYKPTQTTR